MYFRIQLKTYSNDYVNVIVIAAEKWQQGPKRAGIKFELAAREQVPDVDLEHREALWHLGEKRSSHRKVGSKARELAAKPFPRHEAR